MQPAIYFLSGSNRLGEIIGLNDAGRPLGVAAPEMTEETLSALCQVSVPVFVDSGAYSEVVIGSSGPVVVAPITEEDWENVFSVYYRVASALGGQVYLVAPDRVGHQAFTLFLLRKYRRHLRGLQDLGANIIVPVQRGALSMTRFTWTVFSILGLDWVPGIPMRDPGLEVAKVRSFIRACRPGTVHLLGLGPSSDRFLEATQVCDGARVICDSVRIRALVGRTNGRNGGPRALTAAQDDVLDEMTYEKWSTTEGLEPVDYTDEIADPEAWLTPANKRALKADLRSLGLEPGRDLTCWLQQIEWWDLPHVAHCVDAAWARFHKDITRHERRRRAVRRVFGDTYGRELEEGTDA